MCLQFTSSLSQEYGNYFSVITGGPRYKYAFLPDNKIELFPISYEYHPRYGIVLAKLTPDIALAFDEQQKQLPAHKREEPQLGNLQTNNQPEIAEIEKTSSNEKWPSAKCDPTEVWPQGNSYLRIRIEYLALKDNTTLLGFACTPKEGFSCSLPKSKSAYIADSNGKVYDLLTDDGDYQTHDSLWYYRSVRDHEIHRFYLVFPKLESEVPFIYLHNPTFNKVIKIDLNWDK